MSNYSDIVKDNSINIINNNMKKLNTSNNNSNSSDISNSISSISTISSSSSSSSSNDISSDSNSSNSSSSSCSYPFRLLALLHIYEISLPVYDECFKKDELQKLDINNLESLICTRTSSVMRDLWNLEINNKYISRKINKNDINIRQNSISSLDYGYHQFKECHQLIWQAVIKEETGKIVFKFLPPLEKRGTCIFHQMAGSDSFIECKVYYKGNGNNNTLFSFLKDGIMFCNRKYYMLCGEQPKSNKKKDNDDYFAAVFYSCHDTLNYEFSEEQYHVFKDNNTFTDISICRCNVGHYNSHLYQSVDHLIRGFANLSKASVIKRNTRLQLGFSSCNSVIVCNEEDIIVIPDIKGQDNIMTDGCGLISSSFFASCEFIPVVIQIRASTKAGLFKGNLIVSSNEEICPCNKVLMRDSMKKADGYDDMLRCDKAAYIFVKNSFQFDRYRYGMTNHELVLLLQHGNVPRDVFLQLLNRELDNIPNMSDQKKLLKCLEKLKDYSHDEDDNEKNDYVDNVQKLIDMLRSYHNPHKEVYMKILLEKVQISHLKRLVKLKIPFFNPDASLYSSNLVGIPDPTGTLKEGEIFISMIYKVTNKGFGNLNNDDDVIVSRYPMGLPGDIRRLKQRKTPELLEFVNNRAGSVIFFSTQGARSAADIMGGGDFDGDTYIVIYGDNIIVQSFKESDPYNYGGGSSVKSISGNQDYIEVLKSLTKSPEIGKYANRRKASIEFNGPDHEITIMCHKVASDALEKNLDVDNTKNKQKIDNDEECKKNPFYEFTIDIYMAIPKEDVTAANNFQEFLNSNQSRFSFDGKTYSCTESVLTEMHKQVFGFYFQMRSPKEYSFEVNPILLPKSYSNIDKEYLCQWEKHCDDYKKLCSRNDAKALQPFQKLVEKYRQHFRDDCKALAIAMKGSDDCNIANLSIDSIDMSRLASFKLAKIIYYTTYKKYFNFNTIFAGEKAPSVTFCWWVCSEVLNAIQFEEITCRKLLEN